MTEQNHAADAPDFPLLELRDVHAAYGKIEALHGISLSISPGEIVTLIGANGAGKTTILRAISGLLRPSGGTITFNGIDTAKVAAHSLVAQGLAHAPEGRRIFTRMTVRENLELGAFRQRNKRVRIEQMQRMIGYFPILGTRMHQSAGTLSGGEQQMLAIARALMSQPRLLLLDEPSLGLAPLITAGIFEILKTVRSDGTAILLVEQNATQALALAQRGYVLELGRVVVGGESAMLATTPAVRAAYLGE